MKITVISPHRGDAAFALGLTIAEWLQGGHSVEVLNCFTRTEFAPYSDVNSLHENDRMSYATAVRKREDEAWRKQYGGAKLKLTDLNLKDGPSRLHCEPEEVFGRTVDVSEKVVSKICRAVALSRCGALVLPLGASAHVDHVSARDAAIAVLAEDIPLAFYEELPVALCPRLPMEAAAHQLAQTLGRELQWTFSSEVREPTPETAVLRRRRLVLCYDSLLDEKGTTAVAEFCLRHSGRESLWTNAAWRNCTEFTA